MKYYNWFKWLISNGLNQLNGNGLNGVWGSCAQTAPRSVIRLNATEYLMIFEFFLASIGLEKINPTDFGALKMGARSHERPYRHSR